MPAMMPHLIKTTASARFMGFRITLPTMAAGGGGPRVNVAPGATAAGHLAGAQQVQGAGGKRPGAVGGGGNTGGGEAKGTPMNMPPALFLAASNSVQDVDYQRDMHNLFQGLIDGLADAIVHAHSQWKTQARFVDVKINGPIATGGRIEGPDMEQLVKTAPQVAGWGNTASVRDAVAAGLQNCWKDWAGRPKVPGLPWYPAFAAFPGPQAPPMPNIPAPLISCAGDLVPMMPQKLSNELGNKLRGTGLEYADKFADAMAAGISAAFMAWLPMQQVMGVKGKGPIPTFAPPYVPVGPVVMGDIESSPGHLAT